MTCASLFHIDVSTLKQGHTRAHTRTHAHTTQTHYAKLNHEPITCLYTYATAPPPPKKNTRTQLYTLTRSLFHSLTHAHTHTLTHALTHALSPVPCNKLIVKVFPGERAPFKLLGLTYLSTCEAECGALEAARQQALA